jgi:hypothetical protein
MALKCSLFFGNNRGNNAATAEKHSKYGDKGLRVEVFILLLCRKIGFGVKRSTFQNVK